MFEDYNDGDDNVVNFKHFLFSKKVAKRGGGNFYDGPYMLM